MAKQFRLGKFEFEVKRYPAKHKREAHIGIAYRRVDSKSDPFGFGIRAWWHGEFLPIDASNADIKNAARDLAANPDPRM